MNSARRDTYTGIGLAVLATFIWSGNFIIAKGVNKQIHPVSLAFYRWLLASAIIFPIAVKQFRSEWSYVKQSWHFFFWVALLGITMFNTFVYIGAHFTTAINLTLIGTTSSPIMATILAAIFLKEAISWTKLTGLLFCVTGVLFLLCNGNLKNLLTLEFSKGDLWG